MIIELYSYLHYTLAGKVVLSSFELSGKATVNTLARFIAEKLTDQNKASLFQGPKKITLPDFNLTPDKAHNMQDQG